MSQIKHRHSIRLKGYDYSQDGLYFVTICCQDRVCVFGEVVNGVMVLNKFGAIAQNELLKTTDIHPNVEIISFVVMPNHVHFIIHIMREVTRRGELHSPIDDKNEMGELHWPIENGDMHLPNINGEYHSPENGECNSPLQGPVQTVGAMVRGYKSAVTKQINILGFSKKLWQRNYYEHIIRTLELYENIANYIDCNPVKWNEDRFQKK